MGEKKEYEWQLNLKDVKRDVVDGKKMCCANCQKCLIPQLADYSNGGCETTWEEGFVCMAFCHENPPVAMRMVGLDPGTAKCEEFVPKKG